MQILVLGAGSWGTALALTLSDNGNDIWLWSNEFDHVQEMLATGQNAKFLPNKFPDSIQPIADFTKQAKQAKDIIVVVPSHGFRGTLEMLAPHISDTARVCWATKGLENNTGLLLHQVAEQVLGKDRS
ncbi:MAG: NAD(P)-binding domain-containing protein, partial [Proteobacteria bacterium]|nr:NAD(P)-binding domain-containing protein [Pseudomonadota bacterium]